MEGKGKKEKNYCNGKIYCIRNNEDDDIYIGSTTQPLSKRFYKHKQSLQMASRSRYKIYQKMTDIGEDKFYIELLEEYPCENVEQLRKREGELIRQYKPTLNKQIAGRTRNEWIEENKDNIKSQVHGYYLNNKERIKEMTDQYKEKHKDWYKQYYKGYYENNVEQLKEKSRKRYEDKKQEISQKSMDTTNCDLCGCCVRKDGLKRHQKTNKCKQSTVNENINI